MCLGHDDADAEIVMSGGKEPYPMVKWNSTEMENRTREAQRCVFEALSTTLGSSWEELPVFFRPLSKRATAHPLGGAVMSDDPSKGVVDDRCRVYRADGSTHNTILVCMLIPVTLPSPMAWSGLWK
jgi:choline dehydrogenase-like flavoprotein